MSTLFELRYPYCIAICFTVRSMLTITMVSLISINMLRCAVVWKLEPSPVGKTSCFDNCDFSRNCEIEHGRSLGRVLQGIFNI